MMDQKQVIWVKRCFPKIVLILPKWIYHVVHFFFLEPLDMIRTLWRLYTDRVVIRWLQSQPDHAAFVISSFDEENVMFIVIPSSKLNFELAIRYLLLFLRQIYSQRKQNKKIEEWRWYTWSRNLTVNCRRDFNNLIPSTTKLDVITQNPRLFRFQLKN